MKSISVRGLTKAFKVGERRGQYRMMHEWFSFRKRPEVPQVPRKSGSFLALDDVSFDAEPGEVIGLIGRNGAGKSTLLKILARILRPTRGRIELRGRVGSLLEVGSGFHGELTGRENVFLNAAILGMQHREIVRKLDEIVDFSGIGQYLDEPVKTYSSGMYMRLAFSVAAHIEPEILLVDEVLAVGDADFQKKCMQRIEQVGKHGQTVLFVSHNIQAVLRLCGRALLIEHGRVAHTGPVHEVAAAYLSTGGPSQAERIYPDGPYAPGDAIVQLRSVRARSRDGASLPSVELSEEVGLEMEFEVKDSSLVLFPALRLRNEWGAEVLWATDADSEWHGRTRPRGRYRVTAWIPPNFLAAGFMTVGAAMYSFRPRVEHFCEMDAAGFQAVDALGAGTARGDYIGHIGAAVRPKLEWTVEYQEDRQSYNMKRSVARF